MKIGVTGATGQLGRMVVDKLKEKSVCRLSCCVSA